MLAAKNTRAWVTEIVRTRYGKNVGMVRFLVKKVVKFVNVMFPIITSIGTIARAIREKRPEFEKYSEKRL